MNLSSFSFKMLLIIFLVFVALLFCQLTSPAGSRRFREMPFLSGWTENGQMKEQSLSWWSIKVIVLWR